MAITRVGSKKQDQSGKTRNQPTGSQTSRAKNAAELARLQQPQGGFGGDKK